MCFFFDFVKPLKIWAYLDNFFFHSFQGGTKGKMLKNCHNYTLDFHKSPSTIQPGAKLNKPFWSMHCKPDSQKQLIGSMNWILNAIFSHLVLSWSVVKKDSAKLHAISSLTNLCDKKYNFHLCPWPHTDIKSIQYVHTY